MPSFTESFGLIYAEAMSQGLPVIYSKGQGFDVQFKEGIVGYSVKASLTNDIADKIEMVINEYSKISENYRMLVNSFCWGTISERYWSQYQDISSVERR